MSFIAGLTAFYMFRLYYNIFWGTPSQYAHTPHEAPRSMTIPLMILAAITLFAGFIPFGHFVSSDRIGLPHPPGLECRHSQHYNRFNRHRYRHFLFTNRSAIFPTGCNICMPISIKQPITVFTSTSFYLFTTKRIIFNGVSRPIAWFDRHIIDGTMNGMAYITQRVSYAIRGLQSGQIQQYAFVFLVGTFYCLFY